MNKKDIFKDVNIKNFKKSLFLDEKSENTVKKYLRDLKTMSAFMSGKELSKEVLLEYKGFLTRKYSSGSVNSMLVVGNRFLEYMGLPELKVKLIKRQRQVFSCESQELTKGEYLRLLNAAKSIKDERINLIMQTICSTGIRISELRFFTVQSLQSGRFEIFNKGKSRVIFIPKPLRMKLRKYAKKKKIKEGIIFVSKNNKPLDRSNIWRQMKRLCIYAGVSAEKVFPHNLRHLFARTYYSIEKDIIKLADILGHSNIDTTRIYTITTGREHERQIEKLGFVT